MPLQRIPDTGWNLRSDLLLAPAYIVEYLEAALEESDRPAVFLLALCNAAEAAGDGALSTEDKAESRESLCDAFRAW